MKEYVYTVVVVGTKDKNHGMNKLVTFKFFGRKNYHSISKISVKDLTTTNLGKHLCCSLVHLKKCLNTRLLHF